MSKPLTQIEPGTTCIIKETGQSGTLEKIFFYPTKYEVKTDSGEINHYTTHEITFEGYERPITKLNIPEIPFNGIGSSFASWIPFQANSQIKHHLFSNKETIWKMITSLDMYNVWFSGIQRAIPDIQSERYVHNFSFDQLALKPGSYFKIRPASLAPWFRCRIITVEKEKEFGFDFRVSPFFSEYVSFKIEETNKGAFVTCNRTSKGIFSFLSLLNWSSSKSKILQRLAEITPVIDFGQSEDESKDNNTANIWGGYASREDYINYAVNMGLQNNMDIINAIPDKPTRGLAKAGLFRAKRTGETPPMPEKPAASSSPPSSGTANTELSQEQIIAMVVNKALDGNMDPLNALPDKVTRGKAKALIIRINRGSAERPPMPDMSETTSSSVGSPQLTPEQIFSIAVNKAIEGDMEPINSIEDKATRGKAKALLVKIKRGSAEAPPMPEISDTSTDNNESAETESESQVIERLIAAGLGGDMEEINALDNKVLRGKIKAAIVKEKRKK